MTPIVSFQLARSGDAPPIAHMSRDLIETGLGWSWTPARVASQIRCRDSVVLVARTNNVIAGFGIMHFAHEVAHLNLFAVATGHRRRGIATRLLRWLERSAMVAGIATIALELRKSNRDARGFYRQAGYEETRLVPDYYRGLESALHMARFLRVNEKVGLQLNAGRPFVPAARQPR
ncbi:MAG: GNAT family N-acetyltransferase [Gammaproteobacteria bacterium]